MSCPGLISVARLNKQRTIVVIRMLKAVLAELSQNACGEQTKQFVLVSVLQSAQ